MDAATQLDNLLELFARVGVDVAWEHLGGEGGGLCAVRGERRVFVDLDADIATRLRRCAEAAAALPEFETLYISPALRELVERTVK